MPAPRPRAVVVSPAAASRLSPERVRCVRSAVVSVSASVLVLMARGDLFAALTTSPRRMFMELAISPQPMPLSRIA
ncbi:MAG: hypothetical protein CVU22_07860 [Betaproteobacteria bacterium HGW-Betaproteobacteria-16]|nr:MAG: hypothetical protein CVU22_07860 [Betaproteobacteria bacterium HGW-Betaproteobacteria-16]